MKYTYRDLLARHLPEHYLTQALANYKTQNTNEIDPRCCDPDSLENVVLCAFTWCETPEGHAYWSAASQGEFQTAELRLEVGKRYLTRDGRTAEIANEDLAYSPESCYRFDGAVEGEIGFCWSAAGRYESQRENPLDLVSEIAEAEPATSEEDYPSTPPEPGIGYRLLEKGDPIVRGKAEAWHPEENRWYLGPVRGWEGDTFDPDTDYWFREPVPPVYRLLNPGEIIRESDEMYVRGVWEWEPAEDDVATGLQFDPSWQHPIRRPLKSYEDA